MFENALIAAFFAKAILSRWWSQYVRLPSPDTLSLQLHGLVMLEGEKEGPALQFCHSVMRYLLLSYVLAVRRVSSVVQDIFPTSQVSQGSASTSSYHLIIGSGDCPGEADNQVGAGDHGGRGRLGEDLVDATLLGTETYQRV